MVKNKTNFPSCLEDSLGYDPFSTQSHYYQPIVPAGVNFCTISQSDYPTLPSDISMTVESSLRNLVLSVLSLTINIENKDYLYAYKNGISVDINIVQTEASDFIYDKVDEIEMTNWKSVNKLSKCWYCSHTSKSTILCKAIESVLTNKTVQKHSMDFLSKDGWAHSSPIQFMGFVTATSHDNYLTSFSLKSFCLFFTAPAVNYDAEPKEKSERWQLDH